MLGENIKILRKQKGYTQETLAQQLNVVRQTVSKWEKGISVPDAEMLNELSELLEVPVSTLLGNTVTEQKNDTASDEVAKQLAILNEQLASQAARKKKITKRIILAVLIGIPLLFLLYLGMLIAYRYHRASNTVLTEKDFSCQLEDQTYRYSIIYDQNMQIHIGGGDAFIADHVNTEQYDDANVLTAQIQDYFKDRGGACVVSEKEYTEENEH